MSKAERERVQNHEIKLEEQLPNRYNSQIHKTQTINKIHKNSKHFKQDNSVSIILQNSQLEEEVVLPSDPQVKKQQSDCESVAPSSVSGKRKRGRPKLLVPKQQQLCQMIVCLKEKLPNRSLQQIIIKMYETVDQKKKTTRESRMLRNGGVMRRGRKGNGQVKQQNDQKYEDIQAQSKAIEQSRGEMPVDSESQKPKQMSQKNQSEKKLKVKANKRVKKNQNSQQQKMVQQDSSNSRDSMMPKPNDEIQQANINYIYKPDGVEKVIHYYQRETRKVKFINIEEETRYFERRVFAKSYVERGYGVSECRKEIEAEGHSIDMHRNKYKNLAGGVIILAFRKLESFIANDCGKSVRCLDRWQMRAICTVMLNCRTKFQPEHCETLFKYIRAGYGIGDVTIGEIQSAKLFLAIQKYIHGKNVTMEALERMGEVYNKKQLELTVQYLDEKKFRRARRLEKMKKFRMEKKGIENSKEYKKAELQKLMNEIMLAPDLSVKDQSEISDCNKTEESVKESEYWTAEMDSFLIFKYLETRNHIITISHLQQRYPILFDLKMKQYSKRFTKMVKKAIQKIQYQSQICGQDSVPVLNKLEKEDMWRITKEFIGEKTRIKLLAYFVLPEPDLQKLKDVVYFVHYYLYGDYKDEDGQLVDLKSQKSTPFYRRTRRNKWKIEPLNTITERRDNIQVPYWGRQDNYSTKHNFYQIDGDANNFNSISKDYRQKIYNSEIDSMAGLQDSQLNEQDFGNLQLSDEINQSDSFELDTKQLRMDIQEDEYRQFKVYPFCEDIKFDDYEEQSLERIDHLTNSFCDGISHKGL